MQCDKRDSSQFTKHVGELELVFDFIYSRYLWAEKLKGLSPMWRTDNQRWCQMTKHHFLLMTLKQKHKITKKDL